MYRFVSYLFTAMSFLVSAGLIYLAYQYETTGHGLHPALAAAGVLTALCCVIYMLAVAPELDASDEEETLSDITNDIYRNPY